MANPVYQKEVKLGFRSFRMAVLFMIFNSILAALTFISFANMINQSRYYGSMQYSVLTHIYSTMAYIEFVMFLLIIPVITAGSIAGEKERKTLDLLLASKMTPFSIIMGKLEASLNMVRILAFSSMPILSLVFIFGGIRIWDILLLLFTLLVSGIFVGSIGIFFSSVCKKTTTATVFTYTSVLILIFGTYGVIIFIGYIRAGMIGNTTNGVGRWIYILLTNPAATYSSLIAAQVENTDRLKELFNITAPLQISGSQNKWTWISIIVQIFLSGSLIAASAWILNPIRKLPFIQRKA